VMRFVVTLLTPSNQTVRVNYATHDGTAAAGLDFAAASGTLEFAPGVTQRTIDVVLFGGLLLNPANFSIGFTGAQNASLGTGSVTANLPVDRGQLLGLRPTTLTLSFDFVEFVTGDTGEQEESDAFLFTADDAPVVHFVSATATGTAVSSGSLQLGSDLAGSVSLEALAGVREMARY